MRRTLAGGLVMIAALLMTMPSNAQRMTEQFIPIGQSPGLSSTRTDIGTIEAFDKKSRTMTIRVAADSRTVTVSERTRIWLDRSTDQKSNVKGGIDDLKTAREVEIKYEDEDRRQNAEWIKVAPESGG